MVCPRVGWPWAPSRATPVPWDGNDSRRCDHYRRKGFAACLHKSDMRLGDPVLTARILQKGPNRRWGSTSVTGRLSWLEHNGHRVASPRPQHASKRHSGTYVGGSQLGSICHSAKPTTWPHRLMATAVVAVAQLPINGGLPTGTQYLLNRLCLLLLSWLPGLRPSTPPVGGTAVDQTAKPTPGS